MNVRFISALFLGSSPLVAAALGAGFLGPLEHDSTVPAVYPKPRNLKVLPKEMSGDDIDKLMQQYQQYLGVPCGYCHEENPETKQIDYASDENPIKETARFMITMTSDINAKYLAQLGDRRYSDPITCGNCHRGQVQPPSFELKPTQ